MYGARKLGGKLYNLSITRESNTAAQADARAYRKQGFLVRVLPRTLKAEGRRAYHFFDVYVRDKRK